MALVPRIVDRAKVRGVAYSLRVYLAGALGIILLLVGLGVRGDPAVF
jgi:hypothetical protein